MTCGIPSKVAGVYIRMKSVRQKEIIRILEQEKIVNTVKMAQKFGVSVETIRRDFDHLEKQGILIKNYGGAELRVHEGPYLPSLVIRHGFFHAAKAAIAAQAIQYIPDGVTIALDAGSTIFELCKQLRQRKELIVICGDIHSAGEILASSSNKVYMMGGFLTSNGTSSGTFAAEVLDNISKIDIFLCSTDGASAEDGLSTDEANINGLKKQYIKKAKTKIALIDHSKFSKKGFYRLCDFSDIDLLITDSETPSEIIGRIRECGTQVDVVSVPT